MYTTVFCTKEHCTMYTIMYAFHCFCFQRKTLYINCAHNRIFPKIWGEANALLTPPPSNFWGSWPPGRPVADPMYLIIGTLVHVIISCICPIHCWDHPMPGEKNTVSTEVNNGFVIIDDVGCWKRAVLQCSEFN